MQNKIKETVCIAGETSRMSRRSIRALLIFNSARYLIFFDDFTAGVCNIHWTFHWCTRRGRISIRCGGYKYIDYKYINVTEFRVIDARILRRVTVHARHKIPLTPNALCILFWKHTTYTAKPPTTVYYSSVHPQKPTPLFNALRRH